MSVTNTGTVVAVLVVVAVAVVVTHTDKPKGTQDQYPSLSLTGHNGKTSPSSSPATPR
jgi:hypothetical protein